MSDLESIDLLDLEILHDSEMYKLAERRYQPRRRNPHPTGEEEFEDIDIDDLDELLEYQTLLADCLSLWRAGYNAAQIAFELGLEVAYVTRMLDYLKTHAQIRDEDLVSTIQNLYAKNLSIADIAKILKISQMRVRQYLPGQNKALKKKQKLKKKGSKGSKVSNKQYSLSAKQRVLDLCKSTEMSYVEIAKITGINRNTVNRWCKEAFKQQRRKTPLTQEQKEEIRTLCQDTDMSFANIGSMYDVSAQAIARICGGIPRKPRIASEAQRKLARTLIRTTDLTNAQIAERVGVSDVTIGRWRREAQKEPE